MTNFHSFRLEVQASLHVRDSCSNESANTSLSERSTTVSYGDNCSTRALAGSILSVKYQVPAGVPSNISLMSRNSFSTESANVNITEHLGSVSYSDDCSTRGTAGSILSFEYQVPAGVPSNISLMSHDSFSTESANVSITEHTGSVSYSDDCSTRATAGSIVSFEYQVPAGVPSNISLMSHNSFSTESTNFSITEHLGSVSYSDDCSTRATAGSILSFEHQIPTGVPSNISLMSRNSFSTESANVSITEHLGSVSYSDDCSTRGTAGSILGFEYQLPAGVPSNTSLISRDSFSTESANVRIIEHTGSVSYSDDCSTRATAGSILSFEHDVQATVSTTNVSLHMRNSFSNESANTSLSERSTAVSFVDNCSTRALAGSVLSFE
ncbi:uncharacterized protein LOC121367088 [Gigantopelta aegis]|uniref:uncharacterized protein LOC121367088 n=1 Tax=Gigantopelta aegis TaxID=1735272 RepID=UPI001B888D45|nr:uncharacterized protein LOC121367088 [Gigantopelta aegis]